MKAMAKFRLATVNLLPEQAEDGFPFLRWLMVEILAVAGYGSLGIWLSCDTGFAPWQWQFWLMFAPLFAAGELAWRVWPAHYTLGCLISRAAPDLQSLQ